MSEYSYRSLSSDMAAPHMVFKEFRLHKIQDTTALADTAALLPTVIAGQNDVIPVNGSNMLE
jgi:hypothetical protein